MLVAREEWMIVYFNFNASELADDVSGPSDDDTMSAEGPAELEPRKFEAPES